MSSAVERHQTLARNFSSWRRRLHLLHEKVRIPRRAAGLLYRKLHREHSKGSLTRARRISCSNRRIVERHQTLARNFSSWRRRLHLLHEKVRIPRRAAGLLYRKLRREQSKGSLTRARRILCSNRRIKGTINSHAKVLQQFRQIPEPRSCVNCDVFRSFHYQISREPLCEVQQKSYSRFRATSPFCLLFEHPSVQTSVSCQTPFALIFAVVIWVYEIFRISGLLCVTDGLDPLEEQNLGTDQ
ncbi:hypothetical protein F511_24645 [Dorcoceras hygrometricum]|uniref:Uncharacterized protein n=1 Tax=Dorcoceras hygrometricum TaxID=472368 RepID=A0A2Z7D978_9LAMI|nr:hypothetical protein F511_24645 [Dorcoceras hygrometricum]